MENVRFQAASAALWFQAVAIAQFSRCLRVFSRSHQLSDLPEMSQIVHGPLMQHLLQGDFAGLLAPGAAFTGASRYAKRVLRYHRLGGGSDSFCRTERQVCRPRQSNNGL